MLPSVERDDRHGPRRPALVALPDVYGRVVGVTVLGVGGHAVTVEASVGRGLPSLTVTGLPGAAVQDARDRIRPAMEQAGLEWPLRRVVVNLAPGNLRKEGAGLDLPIAVSVLVATAQVPARSVPGFTFFGELSLKGEVLPTPGVISVAIAAARRGSSGVVVPAGERRRGGPGGRAPGRRGRHAPGCRGLPARILDGARRAAGRAGAPPRRRGRSRRGAWTGAGPPRARGRGRRRAQPPDGGLAGRRQDDARATAADDPSRHDP